MYETTLKVWGSYCKIQLAMGWNRYIDRHTPFMFGHVTSYCHPLHTLTSFPVVWEWEWSGNEIGLGMGVVWEWDWSGNEIGLGMGVVLEWEWSGNESACMYMWVQQQSIFQMGMRWMTNAPIAMTTFWQQDCMVLLASKARPLENWQLGYKPLVLQSKVLENWQLGDDTTAPYKGKTITGTEWN